MEIRDTVLKDMQFREADEKLVLAGYFVRFDDVNVINEYTTESIERGAFDKSVNGDIRALYNHNSDFILGRTSSNTLKLRQDDFGLYGEIEINKNDSMARDVYERIKRGDITGCSFGFDVDEQICEIDERGHAHWTIKSVDPLYEVSPCVFPAYQNTSIVSRSAESLQKRIEETDRLIAEKRSKELNEWKTRVNEKVVNNA